MTLYIADIASYQDGLTAEKLIAAGILAVNVKTSHGLGQKSVHPAAGTWLADTRLQRSTFHWLTADASGADQARYAHGRLVAHGATTKMVHTVDMEADGITWAIYRDYVTTMTGLLGRPIATYSGDWRWPAGWNGASISPWLWAAPNAGYLLRRTPRPLWRLARRITAGRRLRRGALPGYPGDTSKHWTAGWGGWSELTVMQYRVTPVAGVDVSMSAVRDAAAWEAMEGMASSAYYNWVNDGRPWETARPLAKGIGGRLQAHGYTVYYIGSDDTSHLQAALPEDHCPFSATGWPGKSPYGYVMACDIMPPKPGQKSKLTGEPLPSLQRLGAQLVADKKAGVAGAKCLKYMNWETKQDNGGPCVQDSWTPDYERGPSEDRGHIHISIRSDFATSTASDNYDLVARVMENDMPSAKEVADAVVKAIINTETGATLGGSISALVTPSGTQQDGNYSNGAGKLVFNQNIPAPLATDGRTKNEAWRVLQQMSAALVTLRAQQALILAGVQAENAETVPTADQNARAFLALLDAETNDQVAAVLLTVLGHERAAEVGRMLAGPGE